jgi:uncharacterized protein YuzE
MEAMAVRRLEFRMLFDSAFDMANITAEEDFSSETTVVMDEGVYVDFDRRDEPFAIEIIDVSKKLNLKADKIYRSGIKGSIRITSDLIELKIEAVPSGPGRKNVRVLEVSAANEYGILPDKFKFTVTECVS